MKVKNFGFNDDAVATQNAYGYWEWESHGTIWEYDPFEKRVRNCGVEPGCFWSEWRQL